MFSWSFISILVTGGKDVVVIALTESLLKESSEIKKVQYSRILLVILDPLA